MRVPVLYGRDLREALSQERCPWAMELAHSPDRSS